MKSFGKHGVLRGLDQFVKKEAHLKELKEKKEVNAFEGKFGRIFPEFKTQNYDESNLKALAKAMIASLDFPPTPETNNPPDDEENSGISAGYTYFGQFIDHDITFDPASSLQKQNDINALIDYRTPRFDLDNVYGRGPDDQPYLYDDDGLKFLLGTKITGSDVDPKTRDLPRNSPGSGARRAIIGDPRNDENVIVSQLQGMFLRFHNSIADLNSDFKAVQQLVRWHYQWTVVQDFLPTIVNEKVLENIFPHLKKPNGKTLHPHKPDLKLFDLAKQEDPFMPVEFSVAAYRFGHSMVRPIYRVNQHRQRLTIFPGLVGFDAAPDDLAIDWSLFFDFGNKPNPFSSHRLQPAYKIDTSLVNPLGSLPFAIGSFIPSLAERNLLRGLRLGLPTGQQVVTEMKNRGVAINAIGDDDLRIGKANLGDHDTNKSITSIDKNFAGNAPLWFYVLAEALNDFNQAKLFKDSNPVRLGAVGGRLVAETFAWLLWKDKDSFVYAKDEEGKPWTPIDEFKNENGEFGIAELLKQAMKG